MALDVNYDSRYSDGVSGKPLSEYKRTAVRRELTLVALELFQAHGFDSTTVDRIAEAAGMSRRTFFRYFASKEDLVVGKWELIGDDIVAALQARPADEDDWTALRRALDVVVEHYADPARRAQSLALDEVIAASEALSAAYLVRVAMIERRVADVLRTRRKSRDDMLSGAVRRALAGSASSCLHAAMDVSLTPQSETLGAALDAIMSALRPAVVQPSAA